ncbi:MAG: hydroxyacid dehydrogenase [Chloroflexia bacterium]|nr:hydroxyacid dehydrogenase [Chloroflexia bacterium]
MKVLFIDSTNKALVEILENYNFECFYMPDISEESIRKTIHSYDGVITRSKITFDKELIDKAHKLRFIGRVGAGMENINVEYADSKGIMCLNAPEGNRDAVGEHAVAMLLNLFNNLCRANMQVKNGIWKREANRGTEIGGKTIGIIGYGNTGSSFARKICGFGAQILSYDKYKINYEDGFTEETTLERIFEETDILSLHVPLTEETTYMVNEQFLNKFRKSIYLINTSRGKVVKTDDLARSMQIGKVLGAALDVLEYEKTSFEKLHFGDMPESMQYLIDSDSVILSPHIAGWTFESDYKLAKVLADKIVKAFA